jgi:hypothetical protein
MVFGDNVKRLVLYIYTSDYRDGDLYFENNIKSLPASSE